MRRTAVATIASAVLLATYVHLELPWLLFVAFLPWLYALDRLTHWKHALAAGAAFSVAFTVSVFPWFPAALSNYSGLPRFAAWIIFALLAPAIEPQFLAFALARHLLRGAPIRAAIGGAFVYVGTELVVPKLFFDTISQGVYTSAELRQGAALAGVHGMTAAALLIAEALLYGAGRDKKRAAAALAAAISLAGAWYLYGSVRLETLATPRPNRQLTAGIVQANITAYDKLRAERGAYETVRLILDTHFAMSAELLRTEPRPQLLIWPETVYPTTYGSPKSEHGAELDRELAAFTRHTGTPLIFGAYDSGDHGEYNAAFFLSPDSPDAHQTYRKHLLFPLTEWVPEWLDGPTFRALFPWTGTWSRGAGPQVIELQRLKVLPLICYDAVSSSFVAAGARQGPELIVTLANDAWFPDARAPRLHLLSSAYRSVETGLPQLRATNSGISAFIRPDGELEMVLPWSTRAARTATLYLGSGDPANSTAPPAVEWSPRLVWIAWAIALCAALHLQLSKRAAKKAGTLPK